MTAKNSFPFFIGVAVHLCSLAASPIALMGQDQWANVYKESAWKERDVWQRAPELLQRLHVSASGAVADIGCNEGYLTVKLAEILTSGHVYAVDVSASKLALLKEHLVGRGIENVNVVQGDYDDPKLPANQLDGVVILDTYHEMNDHDKILIHIKSALKANGRLVICEPIAESRRNLSRSEQEAKHEVGIKFVEEDLARAGFKIIERQDPFVNRKAVKGDVMWLLVAEKQK